MLSNVKFITDIPNRVFHRDLETASIHEAAHHVIAPLVGMYSTGIRLRLNAQHADHTERTVVGLVRWGKTPGAKLTRRSLSILGLAGEVAECLLFDRDQDAESIREEIEMNWAHLSETDRIAIGELTWAAVRDTRDLLLAHWGDVVREAKWAREVLLAELED
jgi:hypothetical protein